MREESRKTLADLAQDYYNVAQILEERIRDRNERLKALPPTSKQAYQLKRELNVLYREKADTLESAELLENYYLKEG